jgi:hypothetical protein
MSTPKGSQAYLPIIAVILGKVGDIGNLELLVSATQQETENNLLDCPCEGHRLARQHQQLG